MNAELPQPAAGNSPIVIVGDIGNTNARFARVTNVLRPAVRDGSAVPQERAETAFVHPLRVTTRDLDADSFRQIIAEFGVPGAHWRIASVHRGASQLLASWQWPAGDTSRIHLATYQDFPMAISVEHPDRVGVDRLAAAFAAGQLKAANSSAIVIDAGTAVTIDAVAVDRTFLGGTISPGLLVSLQALNRNANQLPLIEDVSTSRQRAVIGRNTEEAIARGVWWGCVGGVREIVHRTQQELGGTTEIFVTGGDGPRLARYLSAATHVVPDLVWRGLALYGSSTESTEQVTTSRTGGQNSPVRPRSEGPTRR